MFLRQFIASILFGFLLVCLIIPMIWVLIILAFKVDEKIDQACGICTCFEFAGDNPICPVHQFVHPNCRCNLVEFNPKEK